MDRFESLLREQFQKKPAGFAIALTTLAVLYFLVDFITNHRKLSQFPGPPLAAYTRLWLFRQEFNGRMPLAQRAAIARYGSPARLAPTMLVTDDPDLIRHMNAPSSRWTRGTWYDAMRLDPRQNSVFSTRDEKVHAELKQKEAAGYSGREFPALEDEIDARILDLLALIKDQYNGQVMNMANVARFFTLDVLSTIAFGRPFGFMDANADLWDYNKISQSFMLVLGLQLNHPSINAFMSQGWLRALAAPKVTDKKGMGPLLAFARKAVAERYQSDAEPKRDMLGSFIAKGLTQTQAEVEAFLQIIAGSDSTSDVLRFTIFLLCSSPPAHAKLRAEIDAAAIPSGKLITYAEAFKLPYLKACIMEGLRLFPPLFGLKTKTAPVGGDTFKDTFFPEGTEICICDDAVMRRKDIFGPDAESFHPERFLEGDAELQNKRFRAAEVTFGSGRFMCLGRHIAQMELHKTVFELFRTFDFQIADPTKGLDIVYQNVHIVREMNVLARPREL